LVAQIQSASFMNLSSTVGKTALVAGGQVTFQGQPVTLAAKLDQAASALVATVRDANGDIVTEVNLGGAAAGSTEFVWDGMTDAGQLAAPGLYTLELKATNGAGELINSAPYVGSVIAGIGQEGSNILLTLLDGREITPQDIYKWMLS